VVTTACMPENCALRLLWRLKIRGYSCHHFNTKRMEAYRHDRSSVVG
jgi:hypothetical protein